MISSTQTTPTCSSPVSPAPPAAQPAPRIRDSLTPVGLLPRILRSTRLFAFADELDSKMLTSSLGMSYAGVAHYCPNTSPISRT